MGVGVRNNGDLAWAEAALKPGKKSMPGLAMAMSVCISDVPLIYGTIRVVRLINAGRDSLHRTIEMKQK